jgi:hypothetical protein
MHQESGKHGNILLLTNINVDEVGKRCQVSFSNYIILSHVPSIFISFMIHDVYWLLDSVCYDIVC